MGSGLDLDYKGLLAFQFKNNSVVFGSLPQLGTEDEVPAVHHLGS